MLVAPLIHPVLVETGEQLAAGELERFLEAPLLDPALELAKVRPHERVVGEADLVPGGE